jgi:colanic acid biosynthesis glycosyl transferase WcaI
MRILIVNIYFYPDPTGTGWVITELARDLTAQGHAVTVLTTVPHYAGPGHENIARVSRRLWREERLDGIRVIRTGVYVPRRKTLWTRLLNYCSFTLLALIAGVRCGAHDVILSTSPPLSIGLSAWLLSRLKRIPFVFNVQDIYPDVAVLMGMIRNPAWIAPLRMLERLIYRKAALITVISDRAKENLRAKGVPTQKIQVIPNWVDIHEIQPGVPNNGFRRSLPTPSESNLVMFAGNIGLIAGLETVLQAATALQHRPDIHFLLIGEGTAKAELVAIAERMGLRNVRFLPTQPREILPEVLAAADVHLVTLKRQMSTTSVPSKSYTIMASGRPMIAAVDPGSEIWRMVQTAGAGLCVLPEDPATLAEAIVELCDSPERRRVMGECGRAYVVHHHAKSELAGRYGAILEAVARKRDVEGDGTGLRDGKSAPAVQSAARVREMSPSPDPSLME